MMKAVLMLVTALAVSAGLAATALGSRSAPPTLVGTVGPGFTITLTQNGKAVKTLRHGTYNVVVHDKSSIHAFSLNGPGLARALTQVPFIGTKTSTVTLKAGRYRYFCPPHQTFMFGHVTVT
jgi:plastocyanin